MSSQSNQILFLTITWSISAKCLHNATYPLSRSNEAEDLATGKFSNGNETVETKSKPHEMDVDATTPKPCTEINFEYGELSNFIGLKLPQKCMIYYQLVAFNDLPIVEIAGQWLGR